jgi:hypothetical protein
MLEEAYSKVEINKRQVCEWHKCFCDDYTSVNDGQCCGAILCEMTDKRVLRRHQQKYEYQLKAFSILFKSIEPALLLSTLGSQNADS